MKIRITTQCIVNRKEEPVGSIVDVTPMVARQLIELERAVPHREEETKPAQAQPAAKPAKGK